MKESLIFEYKGSRTYVHGTDIFNKTVEAINNKNIEIDNLTMSINSIVKSNLDLVLTEENIVSNENSVRFEIESGRNVFYCLLQESNTEVIGRYEYPEEDIVRASDVDSEAKSILLSQSLEFTTIEKVVALNKGLMEHLFPNAIGKWYFVKLEISNLFFATAKSISVKMIRNMHLRLVKSEIEINGEVAGNIYFSLKK